MTIDSHLLEALRHAPDRDAAPAPALSQAILKAGRSAVGQRAAAPRNEAAKSRRWWPWLGSLGGALAAGVVALVVWEQPEIAPPASAPQGVAKEESAAVAPIAEPTAQDTRNRDAGPVAARGAAPTPAAAAVAPGPPAAAAPERPANADDSAAAIEAVKAELAGVGAKSGTRSDLAASAGGAAKPAAPAAAAPSRVPAVPLDRLMARSSDAEALHLNKPEQLRALLASEPTRWQWQAPHTTTLQPADAAARAWFDRLLVASAQRWEPHVGPLPDGVTVPWLRNGKLEVELRVGDAGVLWRAAGGPALWQPMPPEALKDLVRRF